MNLEKDAHKYLVDKGCLSMGQKYTAIEVKKMLVDFAEDQVKLYSQTPVSVSVCELDALKDGYCENYRCKADCIGCDFYKQNVH
jgi:hypothetical protein